MREILILTNNKTLLSLEKQFRDIKIEYVDTSVRDILRQAQQKIIDSSMVLLCNPLCGRLARPFPYISLIMDDFGGHVSERMWNDLIAFEMMDEKNRKVYELYPENVSEDCAVLDRELVETALKNLLG